MTTDTTKTEHEGPAACEFCGRPKSNRQHTPPVCNNIYICRDLLFSKLRAAESALATERARVIAAEAMVEDARFLVSWFEEDHRWANTAQERAAARILASRPAEQAKDSACYCNQYQSSDVPCSPGTCPNAATAGGGDSPAADRLAWAVAWWEEHCIKKLPGDTAEQYYMRHNCYYRDEVWPAKAKRLRDALSHAGLALVALVDSPAEPKGLVSCDACGAGPFAPDEVHDWRGLECLAIQLVAIEAERDGLKMQLEEAKVRQRSAELGLEEFQRSAAVVEERNARLAAQLEAAQASAVDLEIKAEAWSQLEAWVTGLSGSASRTTAEIMRAMARAERTARDQKRAAPVAEEPWTRPVTAVQALQEFHEACARDGLSVDAEHVLAASHPEPAAAQPPPAQGPEPAIDTALFDGLPSWLDDMREALSHFSPDTPPHVAIRHLGDFADAALAFMNTLREHLNEQPKPLAGADVTAIVDARVGELAKAARALAVNDHHAAKTSLAWLAEAAEAGKP